MNEYLQTLEDIRLQSILLNILQELVSIWIYLQVIPAYCVNLYLRGRASYF